MKTETKLSSEVFAICLLAAAALQIMDGLLPKIPIFPWLRLGLSHLIILPFIIKFGSFNGCALLLARNIIALLYGGQIFTSFLISSISGVCSILLFGPVALFLYRNYVLGLLGVSILLAVSFNLFQLVSVNIILIQSMSFFFQVAPLLVWSVLSGSLIAYIIFKGDSWLTECFQNSERNYNFDNNPQTILPRLWNAKTLLLPCLFIWILLIDIWQLQIVTLLLLIIFLKGRNLKLAVYAWPYYFYLIWLHLLGTDGVYIFSDWITREGWINFRYYFIRTVNIILCGRLISDYIIGLNLSFSGSIFARGITLTLPVLPGLFGIAIHSSREILRRLKEKKFAELFSPVIEKLRMELDRRT